MQWGKNSKTSENNKCRAFFYETWQNKTWCWKHSEQPQRSGMELLGLIHHCPVLRVVREHKVGGNCYHPPSRHRLVLLPPRVVRMSTKTTQWKHIAMVLCKTTDYLLFFFFNIFLPFFFVCLFLNWCWCCYYYSVITDSGFCFLPHT